MAYPEPIPELKGKEAVEFAERLAKFKLSDEQKAFYREAAERYKCKENCSGHHTVGQCVGCQRYPREKLRDNYKRA